MKLPFDEFKNPVSLVGNCDLCGTSFSELYREPVKCPECGSSELQFKFILKGEDKSEKH